VSPASFITKSSNPRWVVARVKEVALMKRILLVLAAAALMAAIVVASAAPAFALPSPSPIAEIACGKVPVDVPFCDQPPGG